MIAYLNGKLSHKDPTFVIIDIHGVGYLVKISLNTFSEIGDKEQIMLHTYLHIKEDGHTLYGFVKESEKKLFMDLISVNGVGPNTALMVLSSLQTGELEAAILHGDHGTIQRVKGIGAKTAQRIVLEMKDKVSKDGTGMLDSQATGFIKSSNKIKEEALQALVTLGFPKAAAEKNIASVLKKNGPEISLEALIKASLKST